ncbi:hypothetical protein B0I35DRAFT_476163 [Stachybotrys elegans]|uniref:U6 small nuclear RNA (adenine-(43)-N(6))-methyltransferase n=1 Tax=Stachybotrys elegans TaxID=80388 RepID=A0A8K0WU95_9HYPO|nr:hypothetical protein B0I35DRAFT_476163 [Stachybotrys elegans]
MERGGKPAVDAAGDDRSTTVSSLVADDAKDRYYRDLYTTAPDFKDLARLDPDFAAITKGRDIDFNNPASVMQLTKTLLRLDFNLSIDLPDNRLCPPVPNRHNYILWLKDLLDTSTYDQPRRGVVGLDIGTGSSCIYPLLGCAQRPWSFIATDIDPQNLEWSRKNVALNNFQHRIKVVARRPEDSLLPLDDLNLNSIDFCMTNPPFTRSKIEMIVQGGEAGFVDRILEESLVLRERVQWYTAMFGFLASAIRLVDKLRALGVDNYAVTEFIQGTKTRRWAVAWSFQTMRPVQDAARGVKTALSKNILPAVTEADVVRLSLPEGIGKMAEDLSSAVSKLELISWQWDKEKLEGIGRAPGIVWNRAWRRRRKREQEGTTDKMADDPTVFGFKIRIHVARDGLRIGCRWLEGHDAAAFESFQGFLKTAAQSAHRSG